MKKQCLFICTHSPLNQTVKSGGINLTKANFSSLQGDYDITVLNTLGYESENLLISKLIKWTRLFWLLFNFLGGNSPLFRLKIKRYLNNHNPDLVFIDHSQLGSLAKLTKSLSPRSKIILSFQNLETQYLAATFKKYALLKHLLIFAARYNEKLALQFADKILTLTVEDSESLKQLYGRAADRIIPITLDIPPITSSTIKSIHSKPFVLFCGSYFPPNIEGLKWFVNNVLTHIPMDLVVLGFNMEKMRENLTHPQLKIIGTVDALEPYYQSALAVINPVQFGAGMNTKSVEALAYGKKLVSTSFAVTGFPQPLPETISLCDDREAFITTLSKVSIDDTKFNSVSQNYANTYFSLNARKQALASLLRY